MSNTEISLIELENKDKLNSIEEASDLCFANVENTAQDVSTSEFIPLHKRSANGECCVKHNRERCKSCTTTCPKATTCQNLTASSSKRDGPFLSLVCKQDCTFSSAMRKKISIKTKEFVNPESSSENSPTRRTVTVSGHRYRFIEDIEDQSYVLKDVCCDEEAMDFTGFRLRPFPYADNMWKIIYASSGKRSPTKPRRTTTVRSVFVCKGICCSSEIAMIEKILFDENGVHDINVNVLSKEVSVQHDPERISSERLMTLLDENRFNVTNAKRRGDLILPTTMNGNNNSNSTMASDDTGDHQVQEVNDAKRARWQLPPWNVCLALVLWLGSIPHFFKDSVEWLEYFKYMNIAAIVLAVPVTLQKAWVSLRKYKMNMPVLMLMAVLGALIIQEYFEGAAVIVIFSVSAYLEKMVTQDALAAIEALVALQPETATLHGTGEIVPVENVPIGTWINVSPGERVPLDGQVVSGESSVDESSLTGESRPIHKRVGNDLCSGTMNIGNSLLIMEVTAVSSDSTVARLIQMVEKAHSQKTRTEQMVSIFASYYTPFVIFLCLGFATIPWAWGSDVGYHFYHIALVSLVVACPCALIISTPLVYICAISRAAQLGVLIKGGVHFETLSKVGVLCLDKTGTITEGKFAVRDIVTVEGVEDMWKKTLTNLALSDSQKNQVYKYPIGSRQFMLHLVGNMEKSSKHPLAISLTSYCRQQGIELGDNNDAERTTATLQVIRGEGIQGTLPNIFVGMPQVMVSIGNAKMMRRLKIDLSSYKVDGDSPETKPRQFSSCTTAESISSKWINEGGTVCFVAINGILLGALNCNDNPREHSEEALALLHQQGIATQMLTGDNDGSAKSISKTVGNIDLVYSELLPDDKLKILQRTIKSARDGHLGLIGNDRYRGRKGATVGMVGDGINDAPALALADVSIAMGISGSAIASEAADIALMGTDLRKLAEVIHLGRASKVKIIENVFFSLFTKIVVFILAFVGYPYLWLAIATDVGTMLLVCLNSCLLLRVQPYRSTTSSYIF
eukprot:g3223.t1